MEVKKNKREESDEQLPDGVEKIFAHKRMQKESIDFAQSQPKLLKYAILTAAFLIIVVYFNMQISYVKAVSVTGNVNLSSEYIESTANIDSNRRFYLTIPFITEIRLKSDPMIADAKVELKENNVISIEVTEKKAIGYRYDGDSPVVLLSDNTTAELKSDYLDIIADIPLITGFDDAEQTRQLCNAFENVSTSVISDIAEISQYELPYDTETMKVLMRTGGYFVSSYHDFYLVNDYHLVVNKVTDSSKCVFAFSGDTGDTVYTRTCPWDETSTTEYWTNADGTVKTNSYGDKIAKHYYTDTSGNDALDANGSKIAIPVDDTGAEVVDASFQEHYEAGYYATGTLVIPDGQ